MQRLARIVHSMISTTANAMTTAIATVTVTVTASEAQPQRPLLFATVDAPVEISGYQRDVWVRVETEAPELKEGLAVVKATDVFEPCQASQQTFHPAAGSGVVGGERGRRDEADTQSTSHAPVPVCWSL